MKKETAIKHITSFCNKENINIIIVKNVNFCIHEFGPLLQHSTSIPDNYLSRHSARSATVDETESIIIVCMHLHKL